MTEWLRNEASGYVISNRVGGMNEGLQILLLGILFQRLHHKNTEFGTKNQVLLFMLVSTR